MPHAHPIYDTDRHFVIDPYSRKIVNQSENKLTLMQNDHNSERFTFEIPRLIEGHDMSLCNRVRIHYINAGGESHNDVYEITDLQLHPDNEELVIFSWLISQNATSIAGTLNFMIHFSCVVNDIVEYAWHTDIYSGIKVLSIINNEECIVEQNVDILEQWRNELVNAGIMAANEAASKVIDNLNSAFSRSYGSITLSASDWNENAQTVSIASISDNTNVFFTPVTEEDRDLASEARLFVKLEGGNVKFTVSEIPTEDIELSYCIIGLKKIDGSIEEYDGGVIYE